MKPVRVLHNPGFEKKAMRGPTENASALAGVIDSNSHIYGWKVSATMTDTQDGATTLILERPVGYWPAD